ncbi:SDR family NAD(P)-dependent oxidoreductase [Novosphingobium mangrovi (ex Huang et al. 2023)]|uniref:SDR family oxidoreductase n=1 Tax=Novosphingobium mangrovi (ex Huang et al. 2023) TaxID=2976432 RepID=A0ABT2I8Q4_9SPHN|nr:SDR family oxidoreductase [Novosphingobium mangrovi (ex Huang et al. 2023)]MCT2401199.1 SDR family oxidoreductase [Novosphingobium mangrovi (ex Huang et al. 2023)]
MNEIVIVTGASRGIGAAIAYQLASSGYTVGCISRSGSLPQVEAPEPEVMARCAALSADVTDEGALRKAIADLAASGARLVGLVNNAGFHTECPSAELSLAEWRAVMAGNAESVIVGCQAAFPFLRDSGGLIVNIGSFFDKLGVKQNLAYCASKAAVGSISRVLAVEWARHGIAVVNIAPGYILTDLNRDDWEKPGGMLRPYLEKRIPGRKPGSPRDIAALTANLFSTSGTFLSGETIYVDGAQALVA